MKAGDPRGTAAFKALRKALKAQRLPCWLDGLPIDYDAPSTHPLSFAADHVIPVSVDPSKALDPANLRPAHRRCNGSRGNRMSVKRRDTSRRW